MVDADQRDMCLLYGTVVSLPPVHVGIAEDAGEKHKKWHA